MPGLGFEPANVGKLQFLDHIAQPVAPENIPRQNVDAARTQQIPHGKLERAGIGARNDRDLIARRQAQRFARQIDGKLQAVAAFNRTVRAADKSIAEHVGPPAWTLYARSGREERSSGLCFWFWVLRHRTSRGAASQGTAPRVLARHAHNEKGGQIDRLFGTDNKGAQLSVELDADAGAELLQDGVLKDDRVRAGGRRGDGCN